MKNLDDLAKAAATHFKQTADIIWDEFGDLTTVDSKVKADGNTMGKYALTAQLGMMMNFPDKADNLSESFNLTGKGKTGSKEFGGPVGHILDSTASLAKSASQEAMEAMGFSDAGATSTLTTLQQMAPAIIGEFLMSGVNTKTSKKSTKVKGV